ncbi:MAG: hypothetical protein DMD58_13585 [Gemmatimonadetes bacterium]|nr:MAG: hypothetical protein DMD58_13585 [Gemmatimonadota bacterium]
MSVATVGRSDLVQKARQAPVARFALFGTIAAILGGIVLVLGVIGRHPERTWWAYQTNFVFWVGLAQGMVVFAATQKLAKGHWSGVIIRFAEAGAAFTTVAVVLFIGLFIGRQYIFTWIHEPRPEVGWWLTSKWFFVRNGAILVALSWLSWRFVRHDTAPDVRELAGETVVRTEDAPRISREAAFLILAYAFGYSLLGYDLIMSLSTKWVSNLFGAFYFMGSFLAGLMALAILSIVLRRTMGLAGVYTSRQQHDLGKLCFGFTVFWAYLMWSQFLVIWYGNLPEETYFIFYRLYGVWRPVGIAVFLLVFLIPFIGLLGVKPKLFAPTMVGFALVSLVGIWLERYLEVVPAINHGAGPAIGLPEIGVTLFFGGLFFMSWAWFASRYPIISPRLAADALEREQH